jgi:hypothetical protein
MAIFFNPKKVIEFCCKRKREVRYVINKLNENIKKLNMWDMACTKTAVMFFVMFLFSIWGGFRDFVLSINPWVLFLGWVIFAVRPLSKFFSKKS